MSRNFELMQKATAHLRGASLDEDFEHLKWTTPEQASGNDPIPVPMDIGLSEMAREEVLRLVHTVFHAPGQERGAVVFAAITSGGGCSSVCAAAAEILARSVAKTVCLVDANFRTPSLHEVFGTGNHFGLSVALREKRPVRDFVKCLQPLNVWLLSCGSAPEASVGLLTSERMAALVGELRAEFDFVLIDTPPVGTYADTLGMAKLGDGLVLILEADVTRREVAARIAARLRESKINILGTVLNKWSMPIPDFLYQRL